MIRTLFVRPKGTTVQRSQHMLSCSGAESNRKLRTQQFISVAFPTSCLRTPPPHQKKNIKNIYIYIYIYVYMYIYIYNILPYKPTYKVTIGIINCSLLLRGS